MILFLSKYPQTESEFRDGFFQRVENIDQFYSDDVRVYLTTSFFKNWKKKVVQDGLRAQISCNVFFHFFSILKLFKQASFVYIQSIYNALNLILFIFFINKFYVLDLHGVVPEELEMQGKKKYASIFSTIEKILFKRVNVCISVTNRMSNHYKLKYPKTKAVFITYAILPSHLKPYIIDAMNQKDDVLEVIYSGNTQVWQNVDLMLKAIKNNLSEKINFTILTREPKEFADKLKEHGIEQDEIVVKSVNPEELEEYYKKSHYGFILRDDILVNQVACPTKIVEYLNYGIKPIVLSEKIGDFDEFGYEYIYINQLNDILKPLKSLKNINVISEIFDKNNFKLNKEIIRIKDDF